MKAILISLGVAMAACLLGSSGSAMACTNDVDCVDSGGNFCGGMVCSWATATHVCAAAGTDPGWCTSDTDCKCHAEGATCVGVHCSFTVPQGTGSSSGSSSTGGTSGAGTTSGGTTGGASSGGGTTGGGTTGGTTTTSGYTSGGSTGCGTARGGTGLVLGFGLLAGLAFLRRRVS